MLRATKAAGGKKILRAQEACEGSTNSARTTFCSIGTAPARVSLKINNITAC